MDSGDNAEPPLHSDALTTARAVQNIRSFLAVVGECVDSMRRRVPIHSVLAPELTELDRALDEAYLELGRLLAVDDLRPLPRSVIDVNPFVTEMTPMFGRLIGRSVRLVIMPADKPAPVVAHPVELERVFLNLLLNARDTMPSGGVLTIEVAPFEHWSIEDRVHDSRSRRYVRLIVRDTGPGMPPEMQSRVLESFFTTKDSGSRSGLEIVATIVHRLNGLISIESDKEAGTRVCIDLPAG